MDILIVVHEEDNGLRHVEAFRTLEEVAKYCGCVVDDLVGTPSGIIMYEDMQTFYAIYPRSV